MEKTPSNRFLGSIFIGGMGVLLMAMVFLMYLGIDAWIIAWLTIVTGSVIGMTAGMALMIRSFKVEEPDGSSS
jgi:hypothetical protein